MERISVFDIMKVGIGPSSSHTLGPWRAAKRFLTELSDEDQLTRIRRLRVDLFGSLAKTGRGHGTDMAILMGFIGEDPATCDTSIINDVITHTNKAREINLFRQHHVSFDPETDVVFHFDRTLPFHPNGIQFHADLVDYTWVSHTYYSVGGGFVIKEGESGSETQSVDLPYNCDQASDVLMHCQQKNFRIWQMVLENELTLRSEAEITSGLLHIWSAMADCIYRGSHTKGHLPGGLNVIRRASQLHQRLIGDTSYSNREEWLKVIRSHTYTFQQMIRLVSCFALAVNEENASFGRVVTAPTNGAAGVIPAVLMYYVGTHNATDDDIVRFLLVAGEIGSLFKKGATISAAQGGCQAEIGVSSAMAAAALTECMGGSVEQALMAAEIAMEHHLGLTCDPIGGLVQIPCIERNAMGAMKAITAANLALESIPQHAKVSLDAVIKTMWQTALDMSDKYKETAEGGLAEQVPVNVIEC